MSHSESSIILHPKFTPASFSTQACVPVIRAQLVPERNPVVHYAARGVGPSILGTTDNFLGRQGKKQYDHPAITCNPNVGKENVERQCGKRVYAPVTTVSSASVTRSGPVAPALLNAAYNNSRPPSQRKHICGERPPDEQKWKGVHVAPSGLTDTIAQIEDPNRRRPASASGRCTWSAIKPFKPDLLAVHPEEDLLQSTTKTHQQLHNMQRHRRNDVYEAIAAGEMDSKPGRRQNSHRNDSTSDVINSKYAPADRACSASFQRPGSQSKYQQAFTEVRQDLYTLKKIANYHRVRSQVSSLALTDHLYECRDAPPDLRPHTAR